MAPFRWPLSSNDLALAKEVAALHPEKPSEWDAIAEILSIVFSNDGKCIEIKGRGCRERMERLLQKYAQDDRKALKRSGTEEEFSELHLLLEDIQTYRRDIRELKSKDMEMKKKKEIDDKKKGEEMRQAAMEGMANRKQESSIESSSSGDEIDETTKPVVSKVGVKRCRASRLTAMEMLENKYKRKAELKEKELEQRKLELDLQKKKYEDDAEERKERLKLEFEERRAFLMLLKDKYLL